MAILSNHCVVTSQCLYTAVQTKFAPIIHLFTSYHCVGIYVSDTQNMLFWAAIFERVIISQVVVIGEVGGFNIGV